MYVFESYLKAHGLYPCMDTNEHDPFLTFGLEQCLAIFVGIAGHSNGKVGDARIRHCRISITLKLCNMGTPYPRENSYLKPKHVLNTPILLLDTWM